MKQISHKRHILKAITWRVFGTIITIITAWVVSGDPFIGLSIGVLETVSKLILYYIHERIWYKIPFGIEKEKQK
jgi:uncharacterized membrane protein